MDTFVVRLWTPAEAAGDPRDARPGVHGTAHHVGSGRIATFRNGQELLALLDDLRGGSTEPGEPDPRPVSGDGRPRPALLTNRSSTQRG